MAQPDAELQLLRARVCACELVLGWLFRAGPPAMREQALHALEHTEGGLLFTSMDDVERELAFAQVRWIVSALRPGASEAPR